MTHWDDVEKEDLKDDMSLIAESLGVEAAKKLVEIFGGDSIYVPKAESILRLVRDRQIYKEFNTGKRYRELAQEHGLTPRHIRVIIKSQRACDPDLHPGARQLELF